MNTQKYFKDLIKKIRPLFKKSGCSFFVAGLVAIGASAAEVEHPVLDTSTGHLAATLTMPPHTAKVPVVLIVSGSGPTDRDGNTPLAGGRNDSLKLLAEALAEAGIASLRYDKRGIGESASAGLKESDLRFEIYVRDAAEWVRYLARDSRFSGVAIVGHSEGALIGMLAARTSPVQAFVSVAGPSEPAAQTLRYQLDGRLPKELNQRSKAILRSLEAGQVTADVPPELNVLFRASVQPYLISWFRYAPKTELRRLRKPCLLLQGTTDVQVRTEDAESLHVANSACRLQIIEGMNHIMKLVPADTAKQMASYGDPTLPISSELISAIADFLKRQTAVLR